MSLETDIQEFVWTSQGIIHNNLEHPMGYSYGAREELLLNCGSENISDPVQRISQQVEILILNQEGESKKPGAKTIKIAPEWLIKYNRQNHRDKQDKEDPTLSMLRTIALKHKQNERLHAQFLGAEFIEPEYWFIRNTESPRLCRLTRNLRTEDNLPPPGLYWDLKIWEGEKQLSTFQDHPLYSQLVQIREGIIRMINETYIFPDLTLEYNIGQTPNGRLKIHDTDKLLYRDIHWKTLLENKFPSRLNLVCHDEVIGPEIPGGRRFEIERFYRFMEINI